MYQRLDWELLLFFASLFVVIHGFQASGAVDFLIARFHHAFEGGFGKQLLAVSGMMLILSNLVSNLAAVLSSGRSFHYSRIAILYGWWSRVPARSREMQRP